MNDQKIVLNQIVRLAYSVIFFLVFATAAVALDLLSQWISSLGVTDFTYYLVSLTAHFILLVDVLLFSIFLLFAAWNFLRGLAE